MIQAVDQVRNAQLMAVANEREILIQDCQFLAGMAIERCGGNCNLVQIYVEEYLMRVGTPAARALLSELQRNNFNVYGLR